MATVRPVTVKGPHGPFLASRTEFATLWEPQDGYSIVADEDGKPVTKPAASKKGTD